MRPSGRSAVAPFRVMEVMRAAEELQAQGKGVLHLEVGQPSTPAPAGARQAVVRAIESQQLGYTGAAGAQSLRMALCHWYATRYDQAVEVDRIVITTGASGSFVLAFLALFEAGERVGVIEPGYPCYRNVLEALGVEAVSIPVDRETGFRPTMDQLVTAGPLDGLVIASPSNPTGTVLANDELEQIVRWSDDNDVRLVVDEIYHGITYGVNPTTALAFSDRVTVINSFSKYFSMTGWRVGWLVAPEPIAQAVERLAQSLTVAPPTVGQVAAEAALGCVEELDANVARYRHNRSIILDGLASMGLEQSAPAQGAFYVYTDVSELSISSPVLCQRWLNEIGVAATPGVDFDRERGERSVRFSYAGSEEDITEAMARLHGWILNHQCADG